MSKSAILINNEYWGHGDQELGKKQMGGFLRSLVASDIKPTTIVFYQSGVKLLAESSPVLDALDSLFESGVDLVACGSCLTHYELTHKIKIGRISDMKEFTATIMHYDKVITV